MRPILILAFGSVGLSLERFSLRYKWPLATLLLVLSSVVTFYCFIAYFPMPCGRC